MNQQPPMEFLAGILVCLIVVLAIVLVIQILFLMTLMRTQKEVAERNRELSPGLVFLTLIPLFGTFWAMYMVPKLANSLRKEFEERGWHTENEGFGRTAGTIWAWGGFVSILISVAQNAAQFGGQMELGMLISILSLPVSLTILICWILFWVQMSQYGKRLREGERGYQSGSMEDDYDDQRRPSRDDDDRFDDDRDRRGRDDH